MTQKLRLDLPLLLPEVPDATDACVERLESVLGRHPGLTAVHVVEQEAHEGSTLVVIANALRLLGYRGPAAADPSSDTTQEGP